MALSDNRKKYYISKILKIYDSRFSSCFRAIHINYNLFQVITNNNEIVIEDIATNILNEFNIIKFLDKESYESLRKIDSQSSKMRIIKE